MHSLARNNKENSTTLNRARYVWCWRTIDGANCISIPFNLEGEKLKFRCCSVFSSLITVTRQKCNDCFWRAVAMGCRKNGLPTVALYIQAHCRASLHWTTSSLILLETYFATAVVVYCFSSNDRSSLHGCGRTLCLDDRWLFSFLAYRSTCDTCSVLHWIIY